ncbi:hypothetical protein [Burkholderia stagnalis]|uniref:hypothetical protein n=1 Tax=Burkholderia stagnalis TaxID=1503054 RepID=UPI000F56ED88|nr:hypothetical protein [Burkholderia stagnalis]
MSKYDVLDGLVLDRIGGTPSPGLLVAAQPVPFFLINANTAIKAESERLAEVEKSEATHNRTTAPAWRIVERRLQALRKGGKIRATSKGWVAVTAAE